MKTFALAFLSTIALASSAQAHDRNGLTQNQTFNQSFDQSSSVLDIKSNTIQYNNTPTYFSYEGYSAAVSSINFGIDSDLSAEHRVFFNIQVPLKSKVQRTVESALLESI